MLAMFKTSLAEEPVLFVAIVENLLILLIAFGVPVTPEQLAAVVAFFTAVGAVFARGRVTPWVDPSST